MNVLVVGCGAMGRTAAELLSRRPSVTRLVLVDLDGAKAERVARSLPGTGAKIEAHAAAGDLVPALAAAADVIIGCVPWDQTLGLIDTASAAGTDLVSITRPDTDDYESIREERAGAGRALVVGCGLEPGLTEILAAVAVRRHGSARRLRVRCGGVSRSPHGPLCYTLLFGDRLPLVPRTAYYVQGGHLSATDRFTGVELVVIPGVGQLEAYHDGLIPTVTEDPMFAGLSEFTQKTLRHPGFAAPVHTLGALGFLSDEPVEVDDRPVSPRALTEALLAPGSWPDPGETDVTIVSVEADDGNGALSRSVRFDITHDGEAGSGTSALALLTALTVVSVGLMVAEGVVEASGIAFPYQVLGATGERRLFEDLSLAGVTIHEGGP
jgi:lysine 6-dehydrogenase